MTNGAPIERPEVIRALGAFEAYMGALYACGVSEMSPGHRQQAINFAQTSWNQALRGFRDSEIEREKDEHARIVKLYKAGQLVEAR